MDRSSRAILILFSFFLVVVGISLWFSRTPDPAPDDGSGENGPAVGTAGVPDRPDVPEDVLRPEPLPPQPGLVISGKVLDAGGRPIEGAVLSLYQGRRWLPSVRLSSDEESDRRRVADLFQYYRADASTLHPLGMDVSSTVEQESPVREDVSAADGTFAFEDAPAGRLRVAATYGRLSSGQVDATGGTPLELVLRTRTRLSGKVVVIEDGRPLAGALVRVYQGGRVRAVETDRDGAFVFDDLPAGETTVLATHPDHAGTSEQPTLSPGEETVLRMSLGRGFELVVVARGFHPARPEKKIYLPYTTVALIREIDRAYVLARTTSDGIAEFTNLPPGRYVVNGRRKGYLAAGSAEISLPLPEGREVEIFLDRAVPSTIRVLDERGYALPGVTLWTGNNREKFEPGVSKMVGTTNRLGEFEFPFDWDGKEAVLFARKPGYGICAVVPADPTEGVLLETLLLPACEFRGRVTRFDGTAISGAEVSLEFIPDTRGQQSPEVLLRTNEEGKFSWPEIPPGEVRVRVAATGLPETRYSFYARGRGRAFVKDFILEDR